MTGYVVEYISLDSTRIPKDVIDISDAGHQNDLVRRRHEECYVSYGKRSILDGWFYSHMLLENELDFSVFVCTHSVS